MTYKLLFSTEEIGNKCPKLVSLGDLFCYPISIYCICLNERTNSHPGLYSTSFSAAHQTLRLVSNVGVRSPNGGCRFSNVCFLLL